MNFTEFFAYNFKLLLIFLESNSAFFLSENNVAGYNLTTMLACECASVLPISVTNCMRKHLSHKFVILVML